MSQRNQKSSAKNEWVPTTKLGRMVKDGQVSSLEQIFLHSLPIKETQIVDHFIPENKMREDVLIVKSVQKQCSSGQRTSFKAFVIVGDEDGHVGFGVKTAKEVALAIRGAINAAKLNIIPVRRGYWGSNIGKPHTLHCAVSSKAGSVMVRLIPAPRGAGIVSAPAIKRLLEFAGIQDIYTKATGTTRTIGNFARATYQALMKTYTIVTPDLWNNTEVPEHLYDM